MKPNILMFVNILTVEDQKAGPTGLSFEQMYSILEEKGATLEQFIVARRIFFINILGKQFEQAGPSGLSFQEMEEILQQKGAGTLEVKDVEDYFLTQFNLSKKGDKWILSADDK